ncbi:MAG: hypothetical protein P1P90_01915 [Patescibacteria group bacterium]|nr:hypothetical protein [Patescibacteria group bacterium]
MTEPLVHNNPDASDDVLAKEAEAFLAKSAPRQAMVQFLVKQNELLLEAYTDENNGGLGWLTLSELRKAFPASVRMNAFKTRPDIRQRITTELTGLRPKTARGKDAEFQSSLIDSAIDDGDIDLSEFECAFNANELVVYMDVSSFWKHFMNESLSRIIVENTPREKDFFAFLLDVFLQDRGALKPILTHYDVRTAIDGETWQKRIPLDKRVAVDKARLTQESESTSRAFTAKQELEIVTLKVLVDSLDLTDLVPILQTAGEKMGLETASGEAVPEIQMGDEELEELPDQITPTDDDDDEEGDSKKG